MAIIGAILASGGFFAKDYFTNKNKQEEFIFKIHKDLYDDSAIKLEILNKNYSILYNLFGTNFALTSYELKEAYEDFQKSLEEYNKFIRKLERYGTSEQLKVANNLYEWYHGINIELNLQYKLAEQVEREIKKLLMIENENDEFFKILDKSIDEQLEKLVRNENRIYYTIGWYQKPVINAVAQYLNYHFRNDIGLSVTDEMIISINSLPELSKKSNEFIFKEKNLPFTFAQHRAFQAPSLEYKGDISFLKQKNDYNLKVTKSKFIASVLENNKSLEKKLNKKANKS